ncbi:MAG: hypothetical protein AB7V18_04600, partial [Pyrinomonadaceae bacterium]
LRTPRGRPILKRRPSSQTARPTSARIETEAARRFAPNSPKGTYDVLAKPDIFICYQHSFGAMVTVVLAAA